MYDSTFLIVNILSLLCVSIGMSYLSLFDKKLSTSTAIVNVPLSITIQYITRIMHMVHALLCFGLFHGHILLCFGLFHGHILLCFGLFHGHALFCFVVVVLVSWLLHCLWDSLAPVPVKQPWRKKVINSLWPSDTINSLWPNDAIWWHSSGSTLAQVMACCLMAPSHYQNQCWLDISKVWWHIFEVNFMSEASAFKLLKLAR